ncbi:hypothetical protein [Haladaptatus salinisoli]|uniref:hypothetical protein n=1 Tax=Haladaptatus salinisoli TaxID=2884876 RepID=UPI001D09A2B7|nr:hypothetical protein [Haladaptatus salinisoli]
MTDDDSPLARVRRAKSGRPVPRRVDGGAIAVGMLVALGAHLVPAALLLLETSDALVRVAALASTVAVPVGSRVAGNYAGGGRTRRGVHGALATVASLAVLSGAAVWLTGSDGALAAFGGMLGVGAGAVALAGAVVLLLVVGIAAGAVGSD